MTPPTQTTDDLRRQLEASVDGILPSPVLAQRIAVRAGVVRRRRRVVAGVAALTAVAAVVVPLTTGWLGETETLPAGREWVDWDGTPWTPDLPRLELPLGDPLDVPYVAYDFRGSDTGEAVLVMDGHELTDVDLEGKFHAVPDGIVIERGSISGDVQDFAESLVLVRPDGVTEVLDSGVIAGSVAARQQDGSVLVVYGWMASPTATSGEIRILDVESGDAPRSVHVEAPAEVRALSVGDLAAGHVRFSYLGDDDGAAPWMLLDLESGEVEEETDLSSYGVSAGGLTISHDLRRQCVVAQTAGGDERWALCDGVIPEGLSPDARWLATSTASYDAETGEQVAVFPLPGDRFDLDEPVWAKQLTMGWESPESLVFLVATAPEDEVFGASGRARGEADWSSVAVRCSVVTGACERIPHPVGNMGSYAR